MIYQDVDGEIYLSAPKAAPLLMTNGKTFSRWCKEGHVRYVTTLGGHRRISITEVNRAREALGLPTLTQAQVKHFLNGGAP